MRNDTLKKKILGNIARLEEKMRPLQMELELQKGMLDQLEAHEKAIASETRQLVDEAMKTIGLADDTPADKTLSIAHGVSPVIATPPQEAA